MTVRELVHKLQRVPDQDLLVILDGYEGPAVSAGPRVNLGRTKAAAVKCLTIRHAASAVGELKRVHAIQDRQ